MSQQIAARTCTERIDPILPSPGGRAELPSHHLHCCLNFISLSLSRVTGVTFPPCSDGTEAAQVPFTGWTSCLETSLSPLVLVHLLGPLQECSVGSGSPSWELSVFPQRMQVRGVVQTGLSVCHRTLALRHSVPTTTPAGES